jgi:hypothetical protein
MRAVVERPEDALGLVQERVDLALVPDVVARRDDVDAVREQRLRRRHRQAHPAREVLAVGGHEVDPALVAQGRQQLLDRETPRLADEVADHQHAARTGRARRVAVGRVAHARRVGAAGHGVGSGYFAYSTARVSRITVTLIWPG